MFTGMLFGRLFASVMLGKIHRRTPINASPDDDHDKESGALLLQFNIGQRMRELIVKKQVERRVLLQPPGENFEEDEAVLGLRDNGDAAALHEGAPHRDIRRQDRRVVCPPDGRASSGQPPSV